MATSKKRRVTAAEVRRRIVDSDSEFDLSDSCASSDDESRPHPLPPAPRAGGPGGTNTTGTTGAFNWEPYPDMDCFYPEWLPDYQRRTTQCSG